MGRRQPGDADSRAGAAFLTGAAIFGGTYFAFFAAAFFAGGLDRRRGFQPDGCSAEQHVDVY